MQTTFGKDINVPTKTTVLGIFDFRAFLNLAILPAESEKAKVMRHMILDTVIDLINQKTGGTIKYINQRDKDFISASLRNATTPEQPTQESLFQSADSLFRFREMRFFTAAISLFVTWSARAASKTDGASS